MNYQAKLRVPINAADHTRGSKDAPIILLEYGDYQCPHCGRAYPVTERLGKVLGDNLRFVFRHFPLGELHPYATNAALAAEAAGRQGKFWDMHGTLFRNQIALDPESLMAHASDLELDLKTWIRDMESEITNSKVLSDFQSGVRSGVNGTPTFFVNGVRYDGDWSYEPFLEELMAVAEGVT
jgi:protein-disulfide isomerase